MGGALAGTGEIETVVAAFSRTGVKADAAQRLRILRVFLAAIGTNHHNACSRSYLRNAIIAHGGRLVIRRARAFAAGESGSFYQTITLTPVYDCDYSRVKTHYLFALPRVPRACSRK